MKPVLILMAHGGLAGQVYESAALIVGPTEGIHTINMEMEDGSEGTNVKLSNVLDNLPHDAPVLIIADLPGGTPCNVAIERMSSVNHIRVLAGLNLGMVIEYALSPEDRLDELCQSVYDAGKDSIQRICITEGVTRTRQNDDERGEDEEGYED